MSDYSRYAPPHRFLAGRIEPYSLMLGSGVVLDGHLKVLTAAARGPFRGRRLIIRARVGVPRWAALLRRLFGWVRFPLLTKRDDIWMWGWFRPAWWLFTWADRKAQREVLDACFVYDVHVGNVGVLATSLPVGMFSGVADAVQLDIPTCTAQQEIKVILSGYGGPLDVLMLGDMLMPAEAEKEETHGMA